MTEVLARDGDEVASGQPLARVDPSDLALRVELARVQLGSAQARMAQIQEIPTKSDLASAQQGLILAQTALINAVRTYTDMRTGGSFSDVASARQALASAESAIIQATDHLQRVKVRGESRAGVSAGRLAVAQSQVSLTNTTNNREKLAANASIRTAAMDNVTAAYGSLLSAYTICMGSLLPTVAGQSGPSIPGNNCTEPVSQPDKDLAIHAYNQALVFYQSAVSSLNAVPSPPTDGDIALANAQAESVQLSYEAAQAKLVAALAGPIPIDISLAEAALRVAQDQFITAQFRVDALQYPTAQDLASSEAALQSAQTALDAAQERLDDTLAGPQSVDVLPQQVSVAQAELALIQADEERRHGRYFSQSPPTVPMIGTGHGDWGWTSVPR